LVPRNPARVARAAVPIQVNDAVYAYFVLEKTDAFRGIATYVLRVSNRTDAALLCNTWLISRAGETMSAYPHPIEIPQQSEFITRVPVRFREFPALERTVAEVVGANVRCVVEAAAPSERTSRRLWPIAAACVAAGALIGGSMLALVATTPRIAALTAPPQVLSGTTVQAQYAAFGSGTLSYIVTAPDGRRLQGGSLPDHSGAIFITIPHSRMPGAYTLRMAMSNALGSVNDSRVINSLPAALSGAWVEGVSVAPAVAKPGQKIEVSYAAEGTSGYVRLIGTDGTIWGQRRFSRNGEASFIVPPFTTTNEMRVVVRVNEGKTSAQSMAGIVVATRSAGAFPIKLAADPSEAGVPALGENGTFVLVKQTVRSDEPIAVRVLAPRNDMRISLTDMQSHEIRGAAASLEPNGIVTLQAPSVSVPTRYTVIATFKDAFGQETVVEPVTVVPR
jgi:hypothetical protein